MQERVHTTLMPQVLQCKVNYDHDRSWQGCDKKNRGGGNHKRKTFNTKEEEDTEERDTEERGREIQKSKHKTRQQKVL